MSALLPAALRVTRTAALRPIAHRARASTTAAHHARAAPAQLSAAQLGGRRAPCAVPLRALTAATRRVASRPVRNRTAAPLASVVPVVIAAALVRVARILFMLFIGAAAAFSLSAAVSGAVKGGASNEVRAALRALPLQPFRTRVTLRPAQALVAAARHPAAAADDSAQLAAMTRRAEAAEAEAKRLAALVQELRQQR
jgi:hypothetical protein